MSISTPTSRLAELPRTECLRLLARTRFGRVGIITGDEVPIIRPVNYVFDERSQSVAFRTAPGTKLHALVAARRAAFEIDGVDVASRTGWSVIVSGVAEEVLSPSERRRLDGLGLEVWAPGERSHWLRIRVRVVSGRRIELAPED